MNNEPQGAGSRVPRSRWTIVGIACFVGLPLVAYFLLMEYTIWDSIPAQHSPPSASSAGNVVQPITSSSASDLALTLFGDHFAFELIELPADVAGESDDPPEVHGPINNPNTAAKFAAWQANRECRKLWDRAPFSAAMYQAHQRDGRWNWGRYNPGGPGGFSAEVSFSQDGGGLKVRIHYSVDTAIDLDEAGRDRNRDRVPIPRP